MNVKSNKKRKTTKVKKIGNKFTILCVIPSVVLMAILCFISISITTDISCKSLKMSMKSQAEGKVVTADTNIDNEMRKANIFKRRVELAEIITNENLSDAERKEILCSAVLEISYVLNCFSDVHILSTNDNMYIGKSGVTEFNKNVYWYNESKSGKKDPYFIASPMSEEENKEKHMFTYIVPIVYGNDIVGQIVLGLDDNYVLGVFNLATNFKEQVWAIISQDGEIVHHNRGYDEKTFEVLKMKHENAVNGNNVDDSRTSFNGQDYIIHTKQINILDNAILLYVVPVKEIFTQYYVTAILIVVISIISIFIIAVCIRVFTKKIVNDINDIRNSISNISKGDYAKELEITSNDEIGMLVDDINGIIKKLRYQAEHDMKTDYYNGSAFAIKVRNAVLKDKKSSHAIIRVDIDNFSFINDIYDWSVGDEILIKVANILKMSFDETAIFGYLGNDIFVVYVPYTEIDVLITRVLKASGLIKSCEQRLQIVAHFGICDIKDANDDISIVCDHAGIALKTVKGNMLVTYAIYNEKFDENHKTQKFVESHKQIALDSGHFFIMLQPKCNIDTGEVVGAEALVRWKNPDTNEVISPGKFIPIFEKNGFIVNLDRFVWEESCRILKSWRDKGYDLIPVSVNVSRVNIFHSGVVDYFDMLVKRYNISPDLLEIEITESALLEDNENRLREVIDKLREKGFRVLMDDFASGYSSMLALQTLPFDVIKIDKALIDHIDIPENKEFVRGVVAFLKDLKKKIVIEGVENNNSLPIIANTGSKIIQGYCFSRPLCLEDFEKYAFGKDEIQSEDE